MKYKLQDLIDIKQFQSLQDMMNEVYNFTTAMLDNEGNILTASGWQDICTKFHRVNSESCKNCSISDSYILSHIHEAKPGVGYKCLNGLNDYAFPIFIDGIHYGNFFTGQFFFEKPEKSFFVQQAKKYGFDEQAYLEALENVPVISEKRLNDLTLFLKELIQVISNVGLRNLKQMEANNALAESQALYHDLVETAQDLIWQADAEGKYTFLNHAWEEVFGYKPEEMIGKKFTDFQTEKWAARDLKEFEKLIHGNTIKGLETVHIGKDGKEIHLLFNAKIVRDNNGNIIGTRGTAFDITKIRKAEEELKESEHKYLSLFSSMNEGVALHEVIYDDKKTPVDYKIVEINAAFEKQTGIQVEKAKDQIASKFYGTQPAPYLDIYAKVADTMQPAQFETYFPPLNKHFRISVFSPQKGMFATVFADISDRKIAERNITETAERYKSLLTNLEAGIVVHAPDTSIIMNNSRASELLGLSDEQLRGRKAFDPYWKFIHRDNSPFTYEDYPVNRIINTKKPFKNLTLGVVHSKNSNVVWLTVSGFPVFENDKLIEIVISFIDISEQFRVQLEIEKLNKELEIRVAGRTEELKEANKELQSFVYSVSHDLRAPLRSIMGFSEIIARRHAPLLNEEGKKYFGYVMEASKNMANLIDDLLHFSRLSKKTIEKENIELNELFNQVLHNLNQDILESNAKIIIPDKLPSVYADKSLILQILANLISNSIKYHRKGVDPEIIVYVEEDKNQTLIKITDNGQGIPKEHFEKIFNIFQRLHNSEEYAGTGIGLSIVKKAVTTLGGKILVESTVGMGSTFTVVLYKNQ